LAEKRDSFYPISPWVILTGVISEWARTVPKGSPVFCFSLSCVILNKDGLRNCVNLMSSHGGPKSAFLRLCLLA
jgi:hypothetical protein